MKVANATNLNRKFGKPRDLQCPPALNGLSAKGAFLKGTGFSVCGFSR